MVYELALPPSLLVVHLIFYVSMLKKYMLDRSHRQRHEEVDIRPNLPDEEVATQILLKVHWSHQGVEEATYGGRDVAALP